MARQGEAHRCPDCTESLGPAVQVAQAGWHHKVAVIVQHPLPLAPSHQGRGRYLLMTLAYSLPLDGGGLG
ncbi:MAG: hypothetical protein KAV87_50495, partial [Desulfobacteraceae bacterium]|nr:hypothetical protein [Desulfobacteraceae bacterium]